MRPPLPVAEGMRDAGDLIVDVVLRVAVTAGALQPGADDQPRLLEPARLLPIHPHPVIAGAGHPAQVCTYSSAARLAECKISWNLSSRLVQ
jgi:hypothetical protein